MLRGITYKRRRGFTIPLVALLCLSLVKMGGMFWVNNTWAVVPDSDPTTVTQISMLLGGGLYDGQETELDEDGDGVIPIAGGVLVRGNGNQDDNREEAVPLRRLTGVLIEPHTSKSVTNFNDRRTVVAYKDFGHLKVMPAADSSIINLEGHDTIKGRLMCCGRPLLLFKHDIFG